MRRSFCGLARLESAKSYQRRGKPRGNGREAEDRPWTSQPHSWGKGALFRFDLENVERRFPNWSTPRCRYEVVLGRFRNSVGAWGPSLRPRSIFFFKAPVAPTAASFLLALTTSSHVASTESCRTALIGKAGPGASARRDLHGEPREVIFGRRTVRRRASLGSAGSSNVAYLISQRGPLKRRRGPLLSTAATKATTASSTSTASTTVPFSTAFSGNLVRSLQRPPRHSYRRLLPAGNAHAQL